MTVTSAQQQSSEGGENTEQQLSSENGSEDHQERSYTISNKATAEDKEKV